MLKYTTVSISSRISTPTLLRATALATSHRQPTNTALTSSLRFLLPALTAATATTTPIRSVHTTSGSVFPLSPSNLQQQRELATRANHPIHIHEHTSSSSISEAAATSNHEVDYLTSFSSPDQDPTLPLVQITRDSTSLIITPPPTSQFHRPNHPSLTFDNIWLRDNCPCPQCVHPSTRQKLHLTEHVPQDMSVSSIQVCQHGLEVTWSRGLQVLEGEGSEGEVSEEEVRVKTQPGGHQSFYPWEMILTR